MGRHFQPSDEIVFYREMVKGSIAHVPGVVTAVSSPSGSKARILLKEGRIRPRHLWVSQRHLVSWEDHWNLPEGRLSTSVSLASTRSSTSTYPP